MSTLELLPTAPVHDIWARREILASFVGKTGVPPGVFQTTRHVKNAKRLLAANLTLVGQENGTKIGKGTRSPTYARRGIHITQPSSHGHMAVRKCLEDQCAAFLCRLPADSRIPLPNTSGRLPGCLELGVMGGGAGGGLAGGLTLLARRRQLQPQIAPQILRGPCLTTGIKNLSLKALQRCGMLRIMWQGRKKRCSCTRCIGTS